MPSNSVFRRLVGLISAIAALLLGLVMGPAVLGKGADAVAAPDASAFTLTLSSGSLVDAHSQQVTLSPHNCPSSTSMVISYPWWVVPEGRGANAPVTYSTSCATVTFRVLANASGVDRSARIIASSGGQTSAVVISQKKANAKELSMVALGDSYSAGAGTAVANDPSGYAPTFIYSRATTSGGTGTPSIGSPQVWTYDKQRSVKYATLNGAAATIPASLGNTKSWPYLLQAQAGLNMVDFRAASGAEALDVSSRAQKDATEMAQVANLGSLQAAADVVTLTLGGNDAGFVDFVGDCVVGKCEVARAAEATIKSKLSNLQGAYRKISTAFPRATIYVVGYPMVSPPAASSACLANAIAPPGANGVRDLDWVTIDNFISILNAKIKADLNSLNDPRWRYVDVLRTDFPGYFCAPTNPMINLLTLAEAGTRIPGGKEPLPNVVHPNQLGNQALANVVQYALSGVKDTTQGARVDSLLCGAYALTDPNIRDKHDQTMPDQCPTSAVVSWNGGLKQDFADGSSIVWSSLTGAARIMGAIGVYIKAHVGTTGFPKGEEYAWNGGAAQVVANDGWVIWSAAGGAYWVHGGIGSYIANNFPTTGFPTTEEYDWCGGRAQAVSGGGYVVWSQPTGVSRLKNSAVGVYIATHCSTSGFPIGNEFAWNGGTSQQVFNGGWVVSSGNGTFWVHGKIGNYISAHPTTAGFPKGEQYTWNGCQAQNVSGGGKVVVSSAGAYRLSGGFESYANANQAAVGCPTSDEYAVPGGNAQNFTKGTLYWSSSTGNVGWTPPSSGTTPSVTPPPAAPTFSDVNIARPVYPGDMKPLMGVVSAGCALNSVSATVVGLNGQEVAATALAKLGNGVTSYNLASLGRISFAGIVVGQSYIINVTAAATCGSTYYPISFIAQSDL